MSSWFEKHRIIRLNTVDSTNDQAKLMQREGMLRPFDVVIANEQTAGRGQRGNQWLGQAGKDLMFTFILPTGQLDISKRFSINEFLSTAILDVLKGLGVYQAAVKWPNDIYIGRTKICGMLIENQLRGSQICQSIVGIGFNVNGDYSNNHAFNATSLREQLNKNFDTESVLKMLMTSLYNRYGTGLGTQEFSQEYQSHLMYRGDRVQVQGIDGNFVATVVAARSDGGLIVRREDGREQVIQHHEFQIKSLD